MTGKPRITLADAASASPEMEHQAFRAAVMRARKHAESTGVYDATGYLMAVVMPVTRVTREDAEARAAHAAGIGPDAISRIAELFDALAATDEHMLRTLESRMRNLPGDDLRGRVERWLRYG